MGITASFRTIAGWFKARKPKSLDQLLAVEFDDVEVRVRVLERLEPEWNQSFRWSEVVRVCFKDAGLYASDVVLVEIAGRERPVAVPTEAKGGNEFFGELVDRGLFPEAVWRKAIGETGGATHCWPSRDAGEPLAAADGFSAPLSANVADRNGPAADLFSAADGDHLTRT